MDRFTKSKTMIFPREIIVGHRTTSQVAELCNRIVRGKSVLIIVDKITKKLSGNEISKILKKAEYNVQEKIVSYGMGIGVFVLFNDTFELIAIFGHKRLREFPVTGGPSTLRTGYRDDQLFDQTIHLFREIGFSGVAMAEYKLDERNNQPVLLEINPRFWGSIQLAISSGVNFPVLYHKIALGYDVVPKLDFKLGEFCRWLLPGDILHFISNPNRFDLNPSFFKFFEKNLHYDIISINDPLPILGIIFESFRKIIT